MLNKKRHFKIFLWLVAVIAITMPARAEEYSDEYGYEVDYEIDMDAVGANAVAEYQVEGTLFQRIADLEQEKVLMQLEKERAQLDLDLERLAAEKIKLQMEVDTISGRAEEQARKLESERKKLESERESMNQQKQNIATVSDDVPSAPVATPPKTTGGDISSKYKLIEIVGAGRQLQATLEDLSNGQKKKVWTGKQVDGYEVRSISLDEGVVFNKDGTIELLNMGVGK